MVEMDDATIGFGCDQASAGSWQTRKTRPVSNNETTEIVDEDKRMAAGASQTLNSKKYADDGELYVQLQTKVCISSIGLPEAADATLLPFEETVLCSSRAITLSETWAL